MPSDRQAHAYRMILYRELTRGSATGITGGFIAPLADISQFGDMRDPFDIPSWMGRGLLNDPTRPGKSLANGALPFYDDFESMPWIWYAFCRKADGYARPGAGTNADHDFFAPTSVGTNEVGSFQIQDEHLEATAWYHRNFGCVPTAISVAGADNGAPRMTVDFIGTGETAETDLGQSKGDPGIPNFSYHDASLVYEADGTRFTIADEITGLRCRYFNGGTRREAWFSAIAGAINTGKINGDGEMSFAIKKGGTGPGADNTFYLHARNEVPVFLDYVLGDKPLSICTKFIRRRLAILLYPRSVKGGGAQNPATSQPFRFANPADAAWRAEYIAPTAGPYNITAGVNDKLGFKRNGGATTTVTLPNGAAVTAQAVVDAINAALAGAAYLFAGRWPTIVSTTKGSSSTVQIDTAVAQTGHALFGFDNVVRSGRSDCPFLTTYRNTRVSDYAFP